MNKSAIITGLGKKKDLIIGIIVVCVIAFGILIPTISYANATTDYYINITANKNHLDELPRPLNRVPYKIVRGPQESDDPNDWDNDGLTNSEEAYYRTDPQHNDTDWDGLIDGAEVYKYKTIPTSPDSDGDFIDDFTEINIYFTNPNKADTDGDGLDDGMEIFVYESNPFITDTDLDHLNDYDEIKVYKTDVNNRDTDEDGLLDGEEIHIYGTSATSVDTDKDGLTDYWEVNNDHNPLFKDNLGRVLGYYVVLPSLSLLVIIFGIVSSVKSQQKYMLKFMEPQGYLDPKLKDKKYIFELISLMPEDKQISVENLMEITGLTKYEVQQLIMTLFDDDFDQSSLEECVIYTTPKSCLSLFTCFYCGSSITNKMNVCPECHEEIVRCAKCKMPIEHHDSYGTCSTGGICGTDKNIIAYLAVEHLCTGCTMKIKYDFV